MGKIVIVTAREKWTAVGVSLEPLPTEVTLSCRIRTSLDKYEPTGLEFLYDPSIPSAIIYELQQRLRLYKPEFSSATIPASLV